MKTRFFLFCSLFMISIQLHSQHIEEKFSTGIYDAGANYINYFEFSPDGRYLAVSASSYARVYTWPEKELVMVLKHSKYRINSVHLTKFSPDSKFITTISYAGNMKVWDIINKKEVKDHSSHLSWMPTPEFLNNTYGINKDNGTGTYFFLQPFAVNKQLNLTTSCLDFDRKKTDFKIKFRTSDNLVFQTMTLSSSSISSGRAYTSDNKMIEVDRLLPAMTFSPDGEWFLLGNNRGSVYIYKVLK